MEERRLIFEKLEEYGFNTDFVQFPDDFEYSGKMHTIYYCEDYPIENFGVVTPMFKSLDIKVRAAIYMPTNEIMLQIRYDYDQRMGGNSYTVEFRHDSQTKEWRQITWLIQFLKQYL